MPAEMDPDVDPEEAERKRRAAKKLKRKLAEAEADGGWAVEETADVEVSAQSLPADGSRKKKKKLEWKEAQANGAAHDPSAEKVDWASKKAQKKKRKKERLAALDEETKAEAKAELNEKAGREKANEALKKKGKLTKKQKYLAAKAEKKAQASGQKAGTSDLAFDLEKALAAAQVTEMDPKALSCFMTGLPYVATERHIVDHFAPVGPATVNLLQDKVTHRANGTGFVTFAKAEHALHACMYTGSKIQGRWIKLRLCEPRDTGLGNAQRAPEAKPEGCLSVVVKCDPSISEASLKRFFVDCWVSNVSRIMDKQTGEFRGTAFIDFEDTDMVDLALKKSGQSIKGMPILVRYKAEKKGEESSSRGPQGAAAPAAGAGGRVAEHNRAPPVPKPSGKKKTFEDSDDE